MNVKGFSVNFLGDSITFGVGVTDIANCRYDNRIAHMLGLSRVNNHSINGSRMAHQTVPSAKPWYDLCFCGRAYDMDTTADMVIVYGGVNDYIHGDAPFGAEGDKTPATFCGGVEFLMTLLQETYPNATIVFMTPARMRFFELCDTQVSQRPGKQPDAKSLAAYVDVIKAAGERHNIPVLDLFAKLPIDPKVEEDEKRYTVDGLHFNDAGHAVLAQCLIDFLEQL